MSTTTTEVKQKTGTGSEASAAAPLSAEELRKMHAYWRAANYLSVGEIYLMDNPLLKEPLQLKHVKPRLLGHWGTTSGQNFLYVHLNQMSTLPSPRSRCRVAAPRAGARTGTRAPKGPHR